MAAYYGMYLRFLCFIAWALAGDTVWKAKKALENRA